MTEEEHITDVGAAVLNAIRAADEAPPEDGVAPDAAAPTEEPTDEFEAAADWQRQQQEPVEDPAEDRSDWITVNGHQYRDMDAVVQALENAQKLISSGAHKQQEPEPQFSEHDFAEPADTSQPLLGLGAPLSGEPRTEQELIDWANNNIEAATKFALANQERLQIRPDLVAGLWNAWNQTDPAGQASFTLQWQKAQQETERQAMLDAIGEMIMPVVQGHRELLATQALTDARTAPGFDTYEQQVLAQIQDAPPEYHQWFETLSKQEIVDELLGIYASIRGKEWLSMQMGGSNGGGGGGIPATSSHNPAPGGATPLPSKAGAVTSTTTSATMSPGGTPNFDEAERSAQLQLLNLARGAAGHQPLDEMPG